MPPQRRRGGGPASPTPAPSPAPTATAPLLRVFSSAKGDHFYTTNVAVRNNAVANLGYVDEGIACHVFPNR